MKRVRVIPVLLVKNKGLVKTIKFKNPNYIGDPINAVKIFNEKEVDEIIILDIEASKKNHEPDIEMIEDIASEAFIPFAYGGGISTIEQIKEIIYAGAEKIILNTNALKQPDLIYEAAKQFGSQSIVVSIDVKKTLWGKYQVYSETHRTAYKIALLDFIKRIIELGAGEIFLNSVDKDGTFSGYDIELIKQVATISDVPVIACGGAKTIEDFQVAVNKGKASAVAAGSMFVYHGALKGILINYPDQKLLETEFLNKI